jgi:murein DD-endopeptidase MepM/ murein hydrolase activator NlpD
VKKFLATLSLLAALSAIAYSVAPEATSRLFAKLTLPFKIAALYTEPADRALPVPVEGVHRKQIADTWHAPRGNGRLHEGSDIFAKEGTPIHSATEGYVVSKGVNNLGGNTVFVIGPGGRRYYYAHLEGYSDIEVGDYVTPKTVLGYVGTTGNAKGTPPHLHFGVYTSSGPVDPLPLLTDRDR